MPVSNAEIAATLNKLGDLLEIEGANVFRVRAYRNAAQTVEGQSRSISDMVAAGEDLSQLPGIGEALAKKLVEIAATGKLSALEKEEQRIPATLADFLKIQGLGPKRAHQIHEQLKIADLKELEQVARDGKLRALRGFGEKIEQCILKYFDAGKNVQQRTLLAIAEQVVQPFLHSLSGVDGVQKVVAAGSYRRRVETVGDIDILAACSDGASVTRRFVGYEDVSEILAQGETRSSVVLRSGLQVDLRVVPLSSYGAALHYFTGSKEHNIAVRARAMKSGLKINEYGVFRDAESIAGDTEENVYRAVGLQYIEPELRENRGEIEAAEKGRLPRLVTLNDIKGDLHCHTTYTDGRATIEELARALRERGYEYMAVTDHSKRVGVAHGLDAARLAQQMRVIERINAKMQAFRILKSMEVDILEDGSLDLPNDILKELDIVTCSVHYNLDLPREKQTERIIRAMDNPCFHVLAHPTGRLIGERAPYDVDMDALMRAAKERGCFMEVNAHPMRLDLNDGHCKAAKEMGLKIAISTDAHNLASLDSMRFGVDQARRGWIEKEGVLNTRSCDDLRAMLRR